SGSRTRLANGPSGSGPQTAFTGQRITYSPRFHRPPLEPHNTPLALWVRRLVRNKGPTSPGQTITEPDTNPHLSTGLGGTMRKLSREVRLLRGRLRHLC